MLSGPTVARVLSIAGSDSGGGAGIQADLKAFAACGVHGMTAITAVTAQNTVTVAGVHHIPPEIVLGQIRAVASDIGVDAVKIGMLGRTETIEAVATGLAELPPGIPVVLDPVMISESGSELLEPDARAALARRMLPLTTVVTPNLPEAIALVAALGQPDADTADARALARALVLSGGVRAAVITGGHRTEASDLFHDGEVATELPGPRHQTDAAHGSGCTHSSVLAARLACGDDPLSAARVAKRMASDAVAGGLSELGAGPGPVDILGLGAGTGRPVWSGSNPTELLT